MSKIDQIQKAKVNMITMSPLIGRIITGLTLVEKKVGSMATDGKHIYWDREFTDKIEKFYPDKNVRSEKIRENTFVLLGVFAHEICHVLLRHVSIIRQRTMPVEKARRMAEEHAANDCVMNGFGLKLTDGLMPYIYYPEYKGLSTHEVYYKILEKYPELEEEQEFWDLVQEGLSGGDPDDNGPSGGGGDTPTDQEVDDFIESLDDRFIFEKSDRTEDEERDFDREITIKIRDALNQAKRVGSVPDFLDKILSDMLEPKVDWRTVLAEWVSETNKEDYSWKRPNIEIVQRFNKYVPSLYSETINIVYAQDTSGSMGKEDTTKGWTEFLSIPLLIIRFTFLPLTQQ